MMNKFKQLCLAVALTLVCGTACAQVDTTSWKYTLPRYEIQFSIGDPLLGGLLSERVHFTCCHSPNYPYVDMYEWFQEETYRKPTISTCALNLSFHVRLCKWFWLGVTASYIGWYTPIYSAVTGLRVGSNDTHNFLLTPTVRFSWLNKELVTLYSGLGVGFGFIQQDRYSQNSYLNFALGGQVTAVGVQVGKRWYGSAEVGIGSQGFLRLGFGYHFKPLSK